MKKSQIQKIIFEELATVLQERKLTPDQIKKMMDVVRYGKKAGDVNNAVRLIFNNIRH